MGKTLAMLVAEARASITEISVEMLQSKISSGADLLLVDGDPLTDVTLLQDRDRIAMIMKGGELYKAPELPR